MEQYVILHKCIMHNFQMKISTVLILTLLQFIYIWIKILYYFRSYFFRNNKVVHIQNHDIINITHLLYLLEKQRNLIQNSS